MLARGAPSPASRLHSPELLNTVGPVALSSPAPGVFPLVLGTGALFLPGPRGAVPVWGAGAFVLPWDLFLGATMGPERVC